jgi:hypothetical protein
LRIARFGSGLVDRGSKSCHKDGSSRPGGCQGFLLEDDGYLGTTPLGWVATKTLPEGWTHEETSRNMPRLSGGQKASCRMDETDVRGRRRAGVGER